MPFTAQTRMSGVDLPDGRQLRKGAANAVQNWVRSLDGAVPPDVADVVDRIAASGGTPLLLATASGAPPGSWGSSTSRTS